jgi:four helix bundle protein
MGLKGYKKLKVWEKAHKFAIAVYQTTQGFPKEELYSLTSQLRRAAFSIPLNIVEGQASQSKREFLNFLNISNRSLVEAEYLLEVVEELGFIDKSIYDNLDQLRFEVAIMLQALMKAVRCNL